MHPLVKKFEEKQLDALKNDKIVHFRVGDLLKVKLVVEEKGKKWVQTSEGICIRKISKGINTTFTIRRVEKDVAMMITFTPYLQDLTVEVLAMSKVRRARLYYLDRCSVKKGRLKPLTHNQINKRKAYEAKENLNG